LDWLGWRLCVQQSAGQRHPRFELFAESFRGLSGACSGVKTAWRGHADDEVFDEA
jgi:hypothetical protein